MNRYQKKYKYGGFEYSEHELYEGEEDKNRISEMNELDRERILDERVKKLIEKKEREEALLKQKSEGSKKKDALQDIKKRRSQKKDRAEERNDENMSSFSSESESGEVDDDVFSSDEDYSEGSRGKHKRRRLSSSDEVLSIGSDEDKKKESNITVADLERVKVSRNFLEKYWEIPIFDKNVENTYVKINYNVRNGTNSYIVGQIKQIVENKDKPYIMPHGRQCNKYIIIHHDVQAKPIQFNIISNSNITDTEFRQWRDKMEKHKDSLPTFESIKKTLENIENVKNYVLTSTQLQEMINKKKEMKILRGDKNMNIAYELAIVSEEFNSARQKYEETGEALYLNRMNELKPKIDNLTKMANEKEREEIRRAEADKVSQINKKNREKQRLNDLKNSLLNRKKKRNNDCADSQYRRRECHPINLFDSGYLKKETKVEDVENIENKVEETKQSLEQENLIINGSLNLVKSSKHPLENVLMKIAGQISNIHQIKKEQIKPIKEDSLISKALGLTQIEIENLLDSHNAKFLREEYKNYKTISLNDLEY